MPVFVFINSRRCIDITKNFRVNEEIRAREVRVVDPSGNQLGIMPVREALRLAEERQLDLVEIAPQAKPPVCRLMDYGKYKYEQSKREKEAKKRQRIVNIKEVKLRPSIEEHDFQVKARNAARFLKEGDKVKATIMFRGREIMHTQLGHQLLLRLAEQVKDLSIIERQPKLEGKNMVMILAPRQDIKPESKQETKQEIQQEVNQE
ncbi:translation initiation factor IF-3 [Desulfofundulus thermosubterraneus]|uniref:Translation initiation factor IF-3 n=1 Tax=Desulfofundulus thermosubterraneus DSM 16057 TaxID=1121432 RepID=A0A1M6F777_9FIRM|nr:translation initiation factor IF-3 [Desulfofundulus thermosubterraneus]SHI93604.1 translation initiation factor IF-3 [Desulfofundulus thermosubterraneus DSM 16057]